MYIFTIHMFIVHIVGSFVTGVETFVLPLGNDIDLRKISVLASFKETGPHIPTEECQICSCHII